MRYYILPIIILFTLSAEQVFAANTNIHDTRQNTVLSTPSPDTEASFFGQNSQGDTIIHVVPQPQKIEPQQTTPLVIIPEINIPSISQRPPEPRK